MSLKSYLESLEIGDAKIKLSSEQIQGALKESGTVVDTEVTKVKDIMQKEIDNYKTTIDGLKEQIDKAPKSDEYETLRTKIAEYEQKETERQEKAEAEERDRILTNNILEAIGDKKFVNEYTKNSIINEVKTALSDTKNAGKSAKDLFESITKDRTDIFENPNQMKDMPDVQTNDIGDKNLNDMSTGIKLNPIFRKF